MKRVILKSLLVSLLFYFIFLHGLYVEGLLNFYMVMAMSFLSVVIYIIFFNFFKDNALRRSLNVININLQNNFKEVYIIPNSHVMKKYAKGANDDIKAYARFIGYEIIVELIIQDEKFIIKTSNWIWFTDNFIVHKKS